jgi:hypothetical protein
MYKEKLRMSFLAGIITESEYNQKLNENTQEVTLYASWLIDSPEAQEAMFPDYLISSEKIPSQFSGNSTPNGSDGEKDVILCTNMIWPLVAEPEDGEVEDLKILMVKFKKPLTEIFLDLDDFDIESFGIDEEPDIDFSKDIPLSELVQYGLDVNEKGWYGCFVNSISSSEILNKKVGSQSEDKGEWTSF